MKNTNYLVIQGWMVNELKLKGNDLLIYAIIYGFSQAENQKFTGSLSYLANWTQSTKQGVLKSIKKLIEKNLIKKEEEYINNVKFCKYSLIPLNKVKQGIKLSLTGGVKLSLPNNKEDNNKEDNKNNKKFLFFKKIIKKYKEPQKIKDPTIEKIYSSLKAKFNKCLKNLGSEEKLEEQIEQYLDFIKTENYRAKAGFEVWINQPTKYLEDWVAKKEEFLIRQKAYNDRIKQNKPKTSEDALIEKLQREQEERE